MDKSDKPAWMKTFDDTYAAPFLPGFWNKSQKNGNNNKVGAVNGGYSMAQGDRGGHSDTSSLYSRYTAYSERSERRRSRRVGLCIVLSLLALIVAILIGLLVYFLFMNSRPRTEPVPGVAGSVRVLNMTYDDDMANTSSKAFRDVAEPFCAELDSYIARSNYSDRYEGCEVIALRNVADVTDCLCLGVQKGSVMVEFHLRFNGSHEEEELKRKVYDIIENGVTKLHFDDVIHVLLKHFLVDIRFDWDMAYDAIEADVKLKVYNLNYSQALANNQSQAFLNIARPFCREVDSIMTNERLSWLATRYTSCRVTKLAKQTSKVGTVSFTLQFDGREPRPLQQGLLYILLTGARNVEWSGQRLKMIGPLLITPYDVVNHLTPVNVTPPEPNVTIVSVALPVFNLTMTPELGNPRSPLFINLTTEFCRDMEKFYKASSYRDIFYSCKVPGFSPNPTKIEVQLGFVGEPGSGLTRSIIEVIRMYARHRIYSVLHLYKVGDLEVILDRITANGLELHTSLRVVNLTYVSDLADPASAEFLHHAVLFCADLADFYRKSPFADRFLECGVKSFTPRPVRIHFYVVFKGTSLDGLPSSHIYVIRRHAPEVPLNAGWRAYLVGDLLVLPSRQDHSVYPTNITYTSTSTPTTDIMPTPTVPPGGEMTVAIITAHLYNFTFEAELLDPSSPRFLTLQQHFCDDVGRVYLNSHLFLTYRGCKIDSFKMVCQRFGNPSALHHFNRTFRGRMIPRSMPQSLRMIPMCRPAPDEIEFSLYFDAPISRDLEWGVLYVLTNKSPKVNLTLNDLHLVEVLHLGDLFLTVREIRLEPTGSTFFSMPSTSSAIMSTSTWIPTSSMTSSSIIIDPATNVTLRYQLYNFTYLTGLGDPNSELFARYQRLFCLQMQEIYKASASFFMLYDDCDINKFGFDQNGIPYIDFTLWFNTGFTDLLLRETVETLEGSRNHIFTVNGSRIYELLPIGGLLLILDTRIVTTSLVTSSMTQTPAPTSSSTVESSLLVSSTISETPTSIPLPFGLADFTFTEDLRYDMSVRFRSLESRFCADIDKFYQNSFLNSYYRGCYITEFIQSERPNDPHKVNFTVLIQLPGTEELDNLTVSIILSQEPKLQLDGYLTIKAGDLYLILDDWVDRSANGKTSTTDLPILSLTSTYTDTPTPSFITFTINPTPSSSTVEVSSSTTIVTVPTTTVDPYYYLHMSLNIYNITWNPDLNITTSELFRRHNQRFCSELNTFLPGTKDRDFRHYIGCAIDIFDAQPMRVNFSLQFDRLEGLDVRRIQTLVKSMIKEFAMRDLFNGLVVYQIGDLFVDIDSFYIRNNGTITTLNVFNAIAFEHRYALYPGNFSAALLDEASFEFRSHAYEFCKDIDSIFEKVRIRNIRERYLGCYVSDFIRGPPASINFTIVFNDTKFIEPQRLNGIIVFSRQVPGETYFYLGDLYVTNTGEVWHYFTKQDMWSTHPYPYPPSTSPPPMFHIRIKMKVLQPGWSAELADSSSAYFLDMAQSFCADVNGWIKPEISNYMRCEVVRFTNNPFIIEVDLLFSGQQSDTLRMNVDTILMESPDSDVIGNNIGLKIGKLYVLDQETADSLTTTSSTTTTTPAARTTTPKPSPTTTSNPCASGGMFHRHPTLCDHFIQCVMGQPVPIPCDNGLVYVDMSCQTPPPGFQCTPA